MKIRDVILFLTIFSIISILSKNAFAIEKNNIKNVPSVATKKKMINDKQPPLEALRISGELLTGSIGGTLLGFYLGYNLYWFRLFGDITLIGIAVGQSLGSTICVSLIGNIGNQTGSFWWTLLGSGIGAVVPACISFWKYTFNIELNSFASIVIAVISIVLPPIGATIAFNLTRKYRTPPKVSFFVSPNLEGLTLNLGTKF